MMIPKYQYLISSLTIFFFILMVFPLSFGQINSGTSSVNIQIPEVAVLDLEPDNSPIQFNFDIPTEAGKPLTLTTNNQTKWLNYTSAMDSDGSARSIYMQLINDDLPEGVSLDLSVGNASGGRGQLGTAVGTISLSQQSRMIVSGIGRAYTGNGANAGHPISYSLSIQDYAKLQAISGTNIQIMVTITD